jgi:prepilin-type N-terminal cleavage/methylation domain-containing protein
MDRQPKESRRKVSPPAQRGFSLLELMIVVAIIGVLSAVGAPMVRDMIAAREDDAALTELKGHLTRFRNLSRTKVVCVEVRVEGNALVGTPYLQCDPLANALADESYAIDKKRIELVGFSATGLVGNPVYNKRGGLNLNGPLTLTAKTRRDGLTHTFVVFPATGLVRSN